jgi:GNAT superfamily N-acetyltransferase
LAAAVGASLVEVIRPLIRGDTNQIRALAEESAAAGFRFVARFVTEIETPSFALDERRQFFLGVFVADQLVAMGGVVPDPYVDDENIGRLRHVYVALNARRLGIGRRLVAALEQRARDEFTALRLRTDTDAAAAFYEALGYRRTREPDATHHRELTTDVRAKR